MKKKTKIIVFSSVLAAVVLALVAIIVVVKFTNKTEDSSFDVWKEKPFVYEKEEEEKTFESYNEPFADVVTSLSNELEAKSEATRKQMKILSAYTSSEGTPTMIIAYNNLNDKIEFIVCKFKDNKLYKTYIESDIAQLSENNDIIIVKNSDIIALRYNISGENASQIIYDFFEGGYCAVKENSYETGKPEDMNDSLMLYDKSATQWSSYYTASVKENVTQSLNDFVNSSDK